MMRKVNDIWIPLMKLFRAMASYYLIKRSFADDIYETVSHRKRRDKFIRHGSAAVIEFVWQILADLEIYNVGIAYSFWSSEIRSEAVWMNIFPKISQFGHVRSAERSISRAGMKAISMVTKMEIKISARQRGEKRRAVNLDRYTV